MRPLAAALLLLAAPAAAGPRFPDGDGAGDLRGLIQGGPSAPAAGAPAGPAFEIQKAPGDLTVDAKELGLHGRCRPSGNAHQPVLCEPIPGSTTATRLKTPQGDQAIAIAFRSPELDGWVLEHTVLLAADGTTPKAWSSILYTFNAEKCFLTRSREMTSLELRLHRCAVLERRVRSGTLLHGPKGLVADGKLIAGFYTLVTPSPVLRIASSVVELPASGLRSFELTHPVDKDGLREAAYAPEDGEAAPRRLDRFSVPDAASISL